MAANLVTSISISVEDNSLCARTPSSFLNKVVISFASVFFFFFLICWGKDVRLLFYAGLEMDGLRYADFGLAGTTAGVESRKLRLPNCYWLQETARPQIPLEHLLVFLRIASEVD